MTRYKTLAAAAMAVLLLAACGSTSDIYNGGRSNGTYELRGTVDSVDVNGHSIYLTNVSGYNSMLSSGGGNSVRLYYNNDTPVDYRGNRYRPENLERGDQISARVDQSRNQLIAESVTVTYNANNGSGTYPSSSGYPNGTYNSVLNGTVRRVDSGRRTIEIDNGSRVSTVDYDASTPVYFNGTTYRPSDLQVGDEINVTVRTLSTGRLMAQDVTVVRNGRNNNGGYGTSNGTYGGTATNTSTLRGTVRYVDTGRHTIELESPNWIAGFNRGTSMGTTIVLRYDNTTGVDAQGQNYSVTNLERGDVVEVQVLNNGSSTPFAQRLYLVRDVRQ